MNKKLFIPFLAFAFTALTAVADTIPSMFGRPLEWRVGAQVSGEWVPNTNGFLGGNNPLEKHVDAKIAGGIRADFSFNPATRQGMLYRGLYQGVGIEAASYFASSLLGNPVSIYVYQGAPIAHISNRLWLGYEWQFGAAMGWKHADGYVDKGVVSTSVTARLGLALKLHYRISDRWQMAFALEGLHFSNGNTSLPNGGVNSLGVSLGVAYFLSPKEGSEKAPEALIREADRGRWFYDILLYGAWRKRGVKVGETEEPTLCPGKFGVAGLQFSPMRAVNRWVAVGPALDLQWNEGAGLAPYWVDGTYGDDVKFHRPPFGKQISVGVSAHAELTMPIFAVNAGLGYDFVSPKGEKRFYQSLTLKTFVTRNLFLNVGYRLGRFKDPQNLMLGLGLRL